MRVMFTETRCKIRTGPSTEYLRHSRRGILVKRSENRFEEEIQTLKRLKTVHWVTERCCTLFEHDAGMLRDYSFMQWYWTSD